MSISIAESLRAARLAKGLSQGALGQRVGIAQSHISKIERGDVDPQLSNIIEIAHALELDVRLVPRKAAPAVDSIIRSTTSSGMNDQQSRFRHDLDRLARTARELASTSSATEFDTLTAAAVDAKLLLASPDAMRTVGAVIKQLQPLLDDYRQSADGDTERSLALSTLLPSVISGTRTLRHFRNQVAHSTPLNSQLSRPAYAFEEEDDDDA